MTHMHYQAGGLLLLVTLILGIFLVNANDSNDSGSGSYVLGTPRYSVHTATPRIYASYLHTK